MYCTSCGVKNADESNYCKQCGHKLEKSPVRISEEDYARALPEEEQVSALLERAYQLRASNDVSGAIALSEEVLRLRPASTSAHSLLGQLYAMQGDRERAIREYERVLQLNPGSIADRVKLDELRDETSTANRTKTPVVSAPVANGGVPLTARYGVAFGVAGIALLLVGSALAWQALRHPSNGNGAATPSVGNSGPSVAGAVNNPTSNSPAVPANPNPGVTQTNPVSSNATPNSAGQNGRGAAQMPAQFPNNTFASLGNNGGYSQPPIVRVPANQNGGLNPMPVSPSSRNNAKKAASSDQDTKVRMGEEEGAVRTDTGQYIIRVNAGESGETTKPSKTDNQVKIAPSENGASDTGVSASAKAQASIQQGYDLKAKGDYTNALRAFQASLTGAGDATASVYQQIASCYRQKGDKSSAKVNYERAISEYQKLIDAGRQVETARNSIRACQGGMRLCD